MQLGLTDRFPTQYTQSKNKFNLWLSWLYSGYIPSNYAIKSAAFSNYVTVFKGMSELLFQVYEVLAELWMNKVDVNLCNLSKVYPWTGCRDSLNWTELCSFRVHPFGNAKQICNFHWFITVNQFVNANRFLLIANLALFNHILTPSWVHLIAALSSSPLCTKVSSKIISDYEWLQSFQRKWDWKFILHKCTNSGHAADSNHSFP